MESEIIYHANNATPIYENEIVAHPHYHHHVVPESSQHHMVGGQEHQHNGIVHHEPVTITPPAPVTGYDSSCWHFMPPDYPYSEDDFSHQLRVNGTDEADSTSAGIINSPAAGNQRRINHA